MRLFREQPTGAYIQREYALRNPREYRNYDGDYWGFSAGEGPGRRTLVIDGIERRFSGYVARGVPYGPDDGTVAPASVFGALPFAPEIAMPAIRRICEQDARICQTFRIPNGLNPTFPVPDDPLGWVSDGYFGLDQGLIVLMIENFRTGSLWNLMRKCPYIKQGLRRAGFTGGWLRKDSD